MGRAKHRVHRRLEISRTQAKNKRQRLDLNLISLCTGEGQQGCGTKIGTNQFSQPLLSKLTIIKH